MASLIPTKSQKSDAPRNVHEERIATARAGMAAGDALWRQKVAEPAPVRPAVHLSSPDRSTLTGITPQANARKSDVLDRLPAAIRRKAEGLDAGQKAFLARVYEVHHATGEHVECTTAEAASVMKLDLDRTERTIAGLVEAGLLARKYSALGTFSGYLPGSLA